MIRVSDVTSHPDFSKFRLVSGIGGLQNIISGTGIFEWETYDDVYATFRKGEFIITTLSNVKNDVEKAEECLRMLITRKVSAIAVKDIYFKNFSENLMEFSNANNVPIFIFSDTFMDDIIYVVRTMLNSFDFYSRQNQNIQLLFNFKNPSPKVKNIAYEMNRFFLDHILCVFITLKKKGDMDLLLEKTNCTFTQPSDLIYSILKFKNGILIIYTAHTEEDLLSIRFDDFSKKMCKKDGNEKIGLSNPMKGLENLNIAIQQAIYANISCALDNEEFLQFKNIGLDQIFIPLIQENYVKEYYTAIRNKIQACDLDSTFSLMETLIEYVNSNEDVSLTAIKLFQHANTIRYRLLKAREVLGIELNAEFNQTVYAFIRFYKIYTYLECNPALLSS